MKLFVDLRIAVLFSLIVVLSLSCGRNSQSNNETQKQEEGDGSLALFGVENSQYKTDCRISDDKRGSIRESINFSENSFAMEWMYFDGLTCRKKLARTSYLYLYNQVEKENESQLSGWTTFAYVVDSTLVTPLNVTQRKIFNAEEAFGFTDWVEGASKEVSGLKYGPESKEKAKKGEVRVITAKLEKDTLYLARYQNGVIQKDNPYVYKRAD